MGKLRSFQRFVKRYEGRKFSGEGCCLGCLNPHDAGLDALATLRLEAFCNAEVGGLFFQVAGHIVIPSSCFQV